MKKRKDVRDISEMDSRIRCFTKRYFLNAIQTCISLFVPKTGHIQKYPGTSFTDWGTFYSLIPTLTESNFRCGTYIR